VICSDRVSNVGFKDSPASTLTVVDVLDSLVTYVPGSTMISSSQGSTTRTPVADRSGAGFPLAAPGFVIPLALDKRGGTIEVVFKVRAASQLDRSRIVNVGTLTQVGGGTSSFEAVSLVNLDGAISIANTVYNGVDGGVKCGTPAAVETTSGFVGSDVTYCYRGMRHRLACFGTAVLLSHAFCFLAFS
jgi:hypothetical protein